MSTLKHLPRFLGVLERLFLHGGGYRRPDGSFLESFNVFQSINDSSTDLQKDGARLGPPPYFKSAWRDTPAEREFRLVELEKFACCFSSVAWDCDALFGDHGAC
jgi:hypothetical protein